MKYLFTHEAKRTNSRLAVISFFFNARGQQLERTTFGMYRSLLHQLLTAYPSLQHVFSDEHLTPTTSTECPSLEVLRDLFNRAVSLLGEQSFIGYIDALDECDEDEVRDMISHFEDLGQQATEKQHRFKICFCSRPYPYIHLRRGIGLVLQDQKGHQEDLRKYIQRHLKAEPGIEGEGIRNQIMGKAAGTFLWVVMVVEILNREYSRGAKSAAQKRLLEIPERLSDLFRDICKRDDEKPRELRLCIQWILFSERSLSPRELYYAVCSGLPGEYDLTHKVSKHDAEKFAVSMSKGLAEVVDIHRDRVVQFVHESVREFFLHHNGFNELWPGQDPDIICRSHDVLRQCCSTYMRYTASQAFHEVQPDLRAGANESAGRVLSLMMLNRETELRMLSHWSKDIPKDFPFLGYAMLYVLDHSNVASRKLCQKQFLQLFPVEDWLYFIKLVWPKLERDDFYSSLARRGFSNLIRSWKEVDPEREIVLDKYWHAIFIALKAGHRNAARAILGLQDYGSGAQQQQEQQQHQPQPQEQQRYCGPSYWRDEGNRTAKRRAITQEIVPEPQCEKWWPALVSAAEHGSADAIFSLLNMKILMSDNWKVSLSAAMRSSFSSKFLEPLASASQTHDTEGRSLLSFAAESGIDDMVILLVQCGAEINQTNKTGECSFCYAVEQGHLETAKLLLYLGADVEHEASSDRNQHLSRALRTRRHDIFELILQHGASSRIDCGLIRDVTLNYEVGDVFVKSLIENGVDLNTKDERGWTPLALACGTEGSAVIAQLLLQGGADPNGGDHGSSFPQLTLSKWH